MCTSVSESYPSALSSDELIVLSLHTGPAASVEVLGLEVGVVQLLRSLEKTTKEEVMCWRIRVVYVDMKRREQTIYEVRRKQQFSV